MHGDIKPTNVLRIGARFAVADFGVSAPLESTRSAGIGLARTIAFWPPESATQGVLQADGVRRPPVEGWRASQPGDVWALAVSAHRMLTGRHITAGTTPEQQYELVCLGRYAVDGRLAPAGAGLLEDCLVQDPRRRRVTTPAQFRQRLAELAVPPAYAGVPWPAGSPRLAALVDLDPAAGGPLLALSLDRPGGRVSGELVPADGVLAAVVRHLTEDVLPTLSDRRPPGRPPPTALPPTALRSRPDQPGGPGVPGPGSPDGAGAAGRSGATGGRADPRRARSPSAWLGAGAHPAAVAASLRPAGPARRRPGPPRPLPRRRDRRPGPAAPRPRPAGPPAGPAGARGRPAPAAGGRAGADRGPRPVRREPTLHDGPGPPRADQGLRAARRPATAPQSRRPLRTAAAHRPLRTRRRAPSPAAAQQAGLRRLRRMMRRLIALVVVLGDLRRARRGRALGAVQHHPEPGDEPGRRHPRPGPRRRLVTELPLRTGWSGPGCCAPAGATCRSARASPSPSDGRRHGRRPTSRSATARG